MFYAILLIAPQTAEAGEFYCYRRLRELKTFEDILPDGAKPPGAHEADGRGSHLFWRSLTPYGMVPGGGEVFIDTDPVPDDGGGTGPILGTLREHAIVAIRLPEAPEGDVVTGWLYVGRENRLGMKPVKFFLNTKLPPPDAKRVFATTKRKHYWSLAHSGKPGAAWFQHQVRATETLAGNANEQVNRAPNQPVAPGSSANDTERLYALFSGGRAINENLQLNRPLTAANPAPRPNEPPPVRIDTLGGITAAEIDWKPLTAGKTPAIDPLAKLVPHDQHALFLPNLKAAETLIVEAASNSSPIWRSLGVDNQMKSVLARYERQLGIGLADLSKSPGANAIKGIVLTGSDPYFVSGTDLGILIETDSPKGLVEFIAEHLEKARRDAGSQLEVNKTEKSGVATFSMRSEDRRISSYLAATANAVILSNSPLQLQAVLATSRGEIAALAASPEYVYFRLKYPRADNRESAFLVLSDATIRRWCGPRWRIGSSRRIRAAVGLATLQADHLSEIVEGKVPSEPLPASASTILGMDLGEVHLIKHGIRSQAFGTLEFQTPISEIPLETVSQAEASSYQVWRDSYQSNWRGAFDPIAVRIKIEEGKPKRIGVDLTVTPLIANTDYRDAIKLIGGASFAATAGDPHPEALIHAIVALDVKSNWVQTGGDQIVGMTNLPKEAVLGWLGGSASLYVDEAPIWKELQKAENMFQFAESHLSKLPIALHVDVTDGLKLALFLSGVRAFAEQSAPGLMKWENLDHKGRKYVRIGEQAGARPDLEPGKERFALYYAPTPRSIVISPNEALIKRFLDRQESSSKPATRVATDGKEQIPKPAALPEWLGRNIGLRLTAGGMKLLRMNGSESYRELLRAQSWANLPILNEWHRLFPDRDPVRLHEELWGERLICPGGGEYVWDDRWRTMESTAFGHPGEPKPGPDVQAPLPDVGKADFGISFEDGGLHGRVEIELSEPGA
jgi:hypothetical protein